MAMYVTEQVTKFSSLIIPPNAPQVHDKLEITVPTSYIAWCQSLEECIRVAFQTRLVVLMGSKPGRTRSAISKWPALQLQDREERGEAPLVRHKHQLCQHLQKSHAAEHQRV